jgi:uncharacterized delta-60 repeat protein
MSSTRQLGSVRAVVLAIGFCLAGFTASVHAAVGELDPSFGSMGKMTVEFSGGSSEARDVIIQPDGKIVACGYGPLNGNPAFAVVRLHPGGLPDESFGQMGKVVTALGQYDFANAVALQSDGEILVAGSANNASGVAQLALARYTAQGELDLEFGTQGKVVTPAAGGQSLFGSSVALQNDGSILVGGSLRSLSGDTGMVVLRYSSSGMPDSSFGNEGMATVQFGNIDSLGKVLIQPDGKFIVAGGSFAWGINRSRMAIARFTAQGLPDENFGDAGKQLTEVGPGTTGASDAVLQPDGKIVLAGSTNSGTNYDFALTRYTAAGKLDDTFGDAGRVITELGSEEDQGRAVALQADGSIVVAGKIGESSTGSNGAFVVARYTPGGVLDPTFNGTGFRKTQIALNDDALGVAIQADTKIVAAGGATNPPSVFALARYIADDTTLPPTLISPASDSFNGEYLTIKYSLPEAASEAKLTFRVGPNDQVITLAPAALTAGVHEFTVWIYHPRQSPFVADGLAIYNAIHTVILSYRDLAGNPPAESTPSTNVVIDAEKPTISVPGVVEAIATDSSGVAVSFDVMIHDRLDPEPTVIFTPPNGSVFPLGPTLVTVTATDDSGNEATDSFYVAVVRKPAVVCMTGQAVPGAGEPDGVPAGSTWQMIGIPSLLGSGEEIGFSGRINTPSGAKQGIVALADDKAKMLLQLGDAARGPSGEVLANYTFAAFREPVWGDVSSFAVAARIAGEGIRSSNDDGLWVREAGGTIREVAREGAVAPDTNGAQFKAFTSIVMTSPDHVFFRASLRGNGITKRNGDSLWEWTATDGLKLLQQTGHAVRYTGGPTEVVRTIDALNVVPKSPGHGRYNEDHISVRYVFADGTSRILSLNSAGPEVELAPGVQIDPWITATDFGTPCIKSPSHLSVLARVQSGGPSPSENLAIVQKSFLIARQSTPATYLGSYVSFSAPVTEVDDDGNQIDAFIARISSILKNTKDSNGIFFHRKMDSVDLPSNEPILQGDEPAGVAGTKFKSFTSFAVQKHGGVVFTAKLQSGSERVTSRNDTGLWANDSLGFNRLLLREGDVIDGKTVRSFTTLGTITGSPAQRRSIRPGNQFIVSRAVFADGSTGIITSNVP